MKKILFLSVVIFFVCSGNALAKPKNGFGLNVGATRNLMDSTYTTGTASNALGSTESYTSSGVSLGIDYQIVFPKQLTLNPFLMISSESTSLASQAGAVMGHSILGLQGRLWQGDLFVGVHGGLYTETLSISGGTSTTSESGSGQGLVVGWEPTNSRWSVMLQGDYATIKYPNQDVIWRGARLSVGYRWK